MNNSFAFINGYIPLLAKATWITIYLAIVSQVIGTIGGLFLALARMSPRWMLSGPALAYTWVIRGTPALVQIFFIYFALPNVGIVLEPIPAAIIAFSIGASAYNAEILRGGMEAVPRAQVEAALAVGMKYPSILRRIILPQAMRIATPSYMSNFISHVKGTSLASVITVRELLLTTQMIYATTFRAFEALTVCAGLYLILTTALTGLQMFLERHLAFERRSLSSRRSRAYSAGRGLPIFIGTPGTRSPQASMDTVLEIKGLKKNFGGTPALCGIDLNVKRGEVICLIGPSGSGKSTLLRCINLLEVPDAGYLKISAENQTFEFTFGKAASAISRRTFVRLRTHVGMVFQHFNLWPHKVAVENVSEALRCVRGVPFDAAVSASIAMLDRVGLADKITAFPDHLSGGQRQRVAMARALAMEPSLMLFDEPTSALDPESVGEVLQVIENVAQSGMTMLVATHEMGFARKVADRILFLDRGVVVEDSSAEEFFSNPTNPRSLKFLTSFL